MLPDLVRMADDKLQH